MRTHCHYQPMAQGTVPWLGSFLPHLLMLDTALQCRIMWMWVTVRAAGLGPGSWGMEEKAPVLNLRSQHLANPLPRDPRTYPLGGRHQVHLA